MTKLFLVIPLTVLLCPGAELPVREVVLYKHGVGYFERAGSVGSGESLRLDFRASEMNDVLKSLVVNGKSGSIVGLRYDSSVPVDIKLSEFPFRIDNFAPLSSILDQLKGAQVQMQIGNDAVTGEIVAARVVAGDRERPERQQITLLLASGEMKSFDLDAASSLRFTDGSLQEQFRDYLKAFAAARSKEKRSVYIDAAGRDLTASYIIPMPIWKSSYRLMFSDTGEPTLEGWAIVDNTTDEDWANVQIALVSGKPISFVSELYSPRFIKRDSAELPEETAVHPELHQGGYLGVAGGVIGGVAGAVPPFAAGVGSGSGNGPRLAMKALPRPSDSREAVMVTAGDQITPSTIAAAANGAEIAELFEYRIERPVTIKKNESAMLPFLQDRIKARKVVLYTDGGALHPLTATELVNSTSKTLDGGPITVFDGGAYAGEALVETVKAGDKRLISYGVDLGTRITNKLDSQEDHVVEIHRKRGVLTTKVSTVRKTSYAIHNADAKPKTLILEHPVTDGFKLIHSAASEVTDKAFRFELKLLPSASREFPVIEEQVQRTELAVTNANADALLEYHRNQALSEQGRKALERLGDLKGQLAQAAGEAAQVKASIQEASEDEERVRRNLQSLHLVSGQQETVQRYATKLEQTETQIASLRDREAMLSKQQNDLTRSIDNLIEEMDF